MGFLTSLFRAATPENPRFDLNDPAAWDALVDGAASATGLTINREIALTYSPWWRGIQLISNVTSRLPLYLYRREGQGKGRASTHPAYFLLRRKPNDFQTAGYFRKLLTSHALSEGNGYAYINRSGDGTPTELLPLDPCVTFPVLEDGRLLYVTRVRSELRKLLGENVIHVKGLGFDGIQGYSVVQKAKESIGLGLGARRYSAVVLKNNGRPSIVLKHPAKLTPDTSTRLRTEWERMHQGVDNAARTAILDQGIDLKEVSFSPSDTKMIETRQFEIREVANWLGLPPHKLGDNTRTGYASLEQENQAALDESYDPWLCAWEDECWDKLLTEEEKRGDTHVVEFLRQALIRADMAARAAYFRQALGGRAWMAQDEVRGMENLNPMGGDAEIILDPLNMAKPGGNPDDPPAPEPPPPRRPPPPDDAALQSAHRHLLGDVVGRMARRLATQAERAAKGGGNDFCAWLDGFELEQRDLVRKACLPVEMALAASAGDRRPNPGELADWLLAAARGAFTAADQATERGLPAAVAAICAGLEADLCAQAAAIFLPDPEPQYPAAAAAGAATVVNVHLPPPASYEEVEDVERAAHHGIARVRRRRTYEGRPP